MDLYSRMGQPYPALTKLVEMAHARAGGALLQHVTGFQTFLNHDYEVSPDVLIPRPETEVLVTAALEYLRKNIPSPVLGLEIGLGSGVLSIEMLAVFPKLKMVASELSPAAETIAWANAERILGDEAHKRLQVLTARTPLEVTEPFIRENTSKADFFITNPPYLASTAEVESDVLANEPHAALFGPSGDPAHFYRVLAKEGVRLIRPQGVLFAEIPHERASSILEFFNHQGCWKSEILLDLTERPRVLIAKLINGT